MELRLWWIYFQTAPKIEPNISELLEYCGEIDYPNI